MRKPTATTILFFFSVAAVAFLFSACAMFQDSQRSGYVLTGNNAERFIGSISDRYNAAEAHYELGCYMQERRKHKPAIEEFKAALAIDPLHVKSYNAMGVSYDALGDHGRAVACYEAALRIYPKLDYALNNLGYSYLLQGKTDLAVEHFKAAVELDGANARYRNNLGLAYARGGRYDAALAEFKESGGEAGAHYNIARLYYREGRYEEAKSHFQEASRLRDPDPEIERSLAAAAALTEIHAKNEEEVEAPSQVAAVTVETRNSGPEESRFLTIPAEALISYSKVQVVRQQLDEAPVYASAPARIDYGLEMRKEIRRKMDEDIFARLDETQALELLSLKAMEERETPRIKIEVANGNGVRRMARTVGDFLRGRDVILMYLSNAGHFNHEETRIYYAPGYLMEAYELAQKLPGRQIIEEVPAVRDGNAEISILIGKDLVPHLDHFRKG